MCFGSIVRVISRRCPFAFTSPSLQNEVSARAVLSHTQKHYFAKRFQLQSFVIYHQHARNARSVCGCDLFCSRQVYVLRHKRKSCLLEEIALRPREMKYLCDDVASPPSPKCQQPLSLIPGGRWGTIDSLLSAALGELQNCPSPDVVFQPVFLSALSYVYTCK